MPQQQLEVFKKRHCFFSSRKSGDRISLFFYIGLDEGGAGTLEPTFSETSGDVIGMSGTTSGVGNFRINFAFTNSTENRVKNVFYSAAERFDF